VSTLLDVLPEAVRTELLSATSMRRFRQHEVVFHEDDPGDSLHIVDGGLFVARSSSTLGHVLLVNVFEAGSIFGELAVLDEGSRRSATVSAARNGRTRVLRRDDLSRLRQGRSGPAIDQFLFRVLIERNRRLNDQLIDLLFTPAPRRIQRQLLRLEDLGLGPDGHGWIAVTQEDLAQMTATTRATVNRVLRDLERRGTVQLGRGRVRVSDRRRLQQICGHSAAPSRDVHDIAYSLAA
jgi:CRP-like cAMP-binding protein